MKVGDIYLTEYVGLDGDRLILIEKVVTLADHGHIKTTTLYSSDNDWKRLGTPQTYPDVDQFYDINSKVVQLKPDSVILELFSWIYSAVEIEVEKKLVRRYFSTSRCNHWICCFFDRGDSMSKNSLTRNISTKVIPTTTDKRSMFHSTLPDEVGVKIAPTSLKGTIWDYKNRGYITRPINTVGGNTYYVKESVEEVMELLGQ